jgi:two-component system LytT family response regulator
MSDKITAIIIDDEKLARTVIRNYLNNYSEIEIVDECKNGYEGFKSISSHKPDLIFLDIQMPKISGFELLELIDDPPEVIFSTAFDHYALKAFEVNAIDYLLKPFSEERFRNAIDKVLQRLTNKTAAKSNIIEKLSGQKLSEKDHLSRVVVKKNNKIIIIPADRIINIEAQDDYVLITSNEGSYLKTKTMKFFEENLDPAEFMRIHRSHIIRIDKIKNIELLEKESYRVTLENGTACPVSKSGYAKLKEILN